MQRGKKPVKKAVQRGKKPVKKAVQRGKKPTADTQPMQIHSNIPQGTWQGKDMTIYTTAIYPASSYG